MKVLESTRVLLEAGKLVVAQKQMIIKIRSLPFYQYKNKRKEDKHMSKITGSSINKFKVQDMTASLEDRTVDLVTDARAVPTTRHLPDGFLQLRSCSSTFGLADAGNIYGTSYKPYRGRIREEDRST